MEAHWLNSRMLRDCKWKVVNVCIGINGLRALVESMLEKS